MKTGKGNVSVSIKRRKKLQNYWNEKFLVLVWKLCFGKMTVFSLFRLDPAWITAIVGPRTL